MKRGIKEVARKAGVSTATVSRVLNGSDLVTRETRENVLRVIKDLNYRPNVIGRALVTQKTNLLGVMLPDVHSEFFSELIRGIDEAARRHRYHIIVASTHSDKKEIESMLGVMQGGHVDGLIIMSPHTDTREVSKHLSPQSKVVFINSYINGANFDSVTVDNYGGAYLMVEHLIKHGHRRISILKGEEHNYDAQERYNGYIDALKKNGIRPDGDLLFLGNFTEESGYDIMMKMLKGKSKPTAVFSSNDAMALGALRALHEKDIIVPGEIAIAGFDDVPSARYVLPSLTSVHVPIHEMGIAAVESLLETRNALPVGKRKRKVLSTSIVNRESCGCHPDSKEILDTT